jgi:hypothetical protein
MKSNSIRILKKIGCSLAICAALASMALAEKRLAGYDILVLANVTVRPDAGIPEEYARYLKDAILRQMHRYNAKYSWFKTITTTMPSSKKGVLLLDAEILSYVPVSGTKRQILAYIPGGEWVGTASVRFQCKFRDGEKGSVILQKEYNSKSTGPHDNVFYAIERGGKHVAKTVKKNR